MTDDKLEAAIARGARAKELLGSELLKEVFAQIESDYVEGWRRTSARDTDARERLWLAVQVLGLVKDHLVIVANDGKLAQAELDRLAGLAPLTPLPSSPRKTGPRAGALGPWVPPCAGTNGKTAQEDIMETATHLGADAPASYALERSAPADTPAYLSTHDAAAVLRKLRQLKANDTDMPDPPARATTAAPEPGHSASLRAFTPVFDGLRTRVNAPMESTAADAADGAAPVDAQDPGERTEGADRQQEPAPIEPPRSWTKEDKELFTSLPRATQERIAERERSRESD